MIVRKGPPAVAPRVRGPEQNGRRREPGLPDRLEGSLGGLWFVFQYPAEWPWKITTAAGYRITVEKPK